jgi:xanthine dehydrogenase molybdopterin-binding subunit B
VALSQATATETRFRGFTGLQGIAGEERRGQDGAAANDIMSPEADE